MASKIATRKPLTIDPSLMIGLGIVPVLFAAQGLSQALLLSSGLILVQICTILLLLLLHRAIPPRYALFFTVVIAGGFSSLWSMFAEAIMPEIFHSLLIYPLLLPALLPILFASRTLPHSHGRLESAFSVILTGLITCLMLCLIALLRESIGMGTVLGHAVFPHPLSTWVTSTPGAVTLAAFVAGLFAICTILFIPHNRESVNDS